MKTRVLIVDDEPQSLKYARLNLAGRGYDVLTCMDAETAQGILESEPLDLVILDIGLPGMDGFELLERLRAESNVPVIMLTARDAEHDKIRALDLGADDYLTKPFSVGELLARLRAVMRRGRPELTSTATRVVQVGKLRIDLGRRKVSVDDTEIRLTPTEFNLVEQLDIHQGRVLTHQVLLERVWGPEYRDETQYLYAYFGRLRQKLEADPAEPRHLLTEQGVGYRLADS